VRTARGSSCATSASGMRAPPPSPPVATPSSRVVRLLEPDPEASHPVYPVKLDPIGFGFLVPVFFVTSGIRLNLRDVLGDPSALALVPLVLALLVLVRAVPAVA
jgi:hypothetical protein